MNQFHLIGNAVPPLMGEDVGEQSFATWPVNRVKRMNSSDQPAELCKRCGKEEPVRLDAAFGIPVYGFGSEDCAIKHGFRMEVLAEPTKPTAPL